MLGFIIGLLLPKEVVNFLFGLICFAFWGFVVFAALALIIGAATQGGGGGNGGYSSYQPPAPRRSEDEGEVYLLKCGNYYKIGKAKNADRRTRTLKTQMPERAEVVHRIRTGNRHQEERYWHRRFAGKRKNGEWFSLSQSDVDEMRRRR